MSRTLQLAEQLISRPSVTPDDAGCQQILGERLALLGFTLETIESGPADFRVTNLWAVRRPADAAATTRTLVFAGHTDVVPTGPVEQWTSHPFTPTHRDGKLYGRGACDMKTSVAAFVTSIEDFLQAVPEPRLTLALLLTSDEEGPGVDGTVVVCNTLAARGEVIDYCIVGEPTAVERCGDMIKNGRRGTMSGKLTVKGVQGHIAYPHLAKNPVHSVAPALAELVAINAAGGWDAASNPYFQPTSWQISNFHSGTGASNVIPGSAVIDFNFRFSTESTPESLQQRVHAVLDAHQVDYTLAWTIGGLPFLTTPGELVTAVQGAIRDETGIETELSTSGGTSDARFIAKICRQVVELGPVNASIHKIDEHIDVAEIETLKNIYVRTLKQLDAALAA
ncbi:MULTISPECIES: succinyl-diaminopimelate desuccinylase [Variovorax]|jgi:succinyl-diaminopimelate desuccinylase|uniref:succinyl-diaminopimelate desuccinylase n=1 Tax=Variovorax TaxID=34072 RepID=UPI00086B780D|nr:MULTISPECIES: succinyl-diaminopimelate desuccinylase [Variovorax]MBN8752063.1 succinyl-diaminopimelate desuccinylase [Variovorax sp.]ODU15488.1 MAG: succinyl-diaminopimelate desuccinylase [Variovorax sp. SCN 67-85]ODV17151.1 MAG: succinyl-diaminopimelate desuccinylase [Variovorax sp. SCN 67-20]OJZ09121.1 MAG: succinyl-diaminopimelate desuccinylase [Variovorax sp. 67-131]UKI11595.1 succinyl-diaminopimelate desuccinylase [Variovorax paradoxus]